MSGPSARGLPQFLRYLGTFPAPRDALEALHHGPLGGYGAQATLLWQVRGDDLVALASVGHTRAEFDQYATLPLTLGLSVVRAVRTGTVIVDTDVATAARPERDMRDHEFRDAILRRGDAASVLRIPLLHGGHSVGAIGLVVDQRWPDDEGTVALTDCISLAMGLWLTNPRVGVSARRIAPADARLVALVHRAAARDPSDGRAGAVERRHRVGTERVGVEREAGPAARDAGAAVGRPDGRGRAGPHPRAAVVGGAGPARRAGPGTPNHLAER